MAPQSSCPGIAVHSYVRSSAPSGGRIGSAGKCRGGRRRSTGWTPPESRKGRVGARPFPTTLLHRRNGEFRAVLDAGGPAGRDGLRLGVEAHRIGTVLVEVAEAGGLPAA